MVCHKPYEFHKLESYQGEADVIIFCFDCDRESMTCFNNKILPVNKRQKQYLHDIATNAKFLFNPKNPIDISKDGKMDRSPEASIIHEQFIKNTIELLIISLMSTAGTDRQKRAELFILYEQRRTLTLDIMNYLNENISRTIRLNDISEKFSYSLSSIKRIFKEETGYSVIDYLNCIRIEKAKRLLLYSSYSIEEISIQSGYSNV